MNREELKKLIKKHGLEKPFNSYLPTRKYTVLVKDKEGKIMRVHFGQKGASDYLKHKDEERRERFKARHKCHLRKDKTKPSYWSCNWSW